MDQLGLENIIFNINKGGFDSVTFVTGETSTSHTYLLPVAPGGDLDVLPTTQAVNLHGKKVVVRMIGRLMETAILMSAIIF